MLKLYLIYAVILTPVVGILYWLLDMLNCKKWVRNFLFSSMFAFLLAPTLVRLAYIFFIFLPHGCYVTFYYEHFSWDIYTQVPVFMASSFLITGLVGFLIGHFVFKEK